MNDEITAENARKTKKLKKKILIVFAVMVVFVIAAFPLLRLLENPNGTTQQDERDTLPQAQLFFEEPDYDYNILKDKEYLSLNRQIMIEDMASGVTEVMDDRNKGAYGEAAGVLYQMIQALINGDTETYNQLFSSVYYGSNGEAEPFTMQQIYDIKIRKVRSETATENGKTFVSYVLYVDYKINKNNGTYRRDIGDGESRTQIFLLSDRTGKMLIDDISTFRTN